MKRGFLFSSRFITAVVGVFFLEVRGCFFVAVVDALEVRPDYSTNLSSRLCAATATAGSYCLDFCIPRGPQSPPDLGTENQALN